jgi:hypothetical protein
MGGEYVEIEVTYPPNSNPPPRHIHPAQDEHFTILSGEMFCALFDVARDNEWKPDLMQMFEVIQQFDDEFCLC